VHFNPGVAEIIGRHYRLPVSAENPRAYLERSVEKFDVIHLEHWGASIGDAAALGQTAMLTVDAFEACLTRLAAGGVFTVSGRLRLPPADTIRLWSTAFEALRRLRVASPSRHLMLLRNWDTFMLIVGADPFEADGILVEFAERMNFDPVYAPQLPVDKVNLFNHFDQPFYYRAIRELKRAYDRGEEKDFYRAYLLDVAPQSDWRPFAARALKWSRLKALYHVTGSRVYRMMLSGEVVVVVVLVEALLISALLLIWPIRTLAGRSAHPSWNLLVSFFGIGAGFMLAELYFINRLVLFCGDPVVAMMLVLGGLLISTGLGSLCSQRLSPQDIKRGILPALGGVMAITVLLLETLTAPLLRLSAAPRYLALLGSMLPIGLIMGMPFPVLMRHHLSAGHLRAYAWAVNGCASVLGSISAAQIAISSGIPWIAGAALLAYGMSWVSLKDPRAYG
jgi:hypothetical protein